LLQGAILHYHRKHGQMLENVKLKLQPVERPKVEGGFKTVFYGIFYILLKKKKVKNVCIFVCLFRYLDNIINPYSNTIAFLFYYLNKNLK